VFLRSFTTANKGHAIGSGFVQSDTLPWFLIVHHLWTQ
jgi:hypothetical protein